MTHTQAHTQREREQGLCPTPPTTIPLLSSVRAKDLLELSTFAPGARRKWQARNRFEVCVYVVFVCVCIYERLECGEPYMF